MPDHTAAEKEKNRRNKSAAAIAAFDAAEQGRQTGAAVRKKKKKHVEKAGTGEKDVSSITKSIEGVKSRLRDAGKTKNLKKARDLAGRLEGLRKIRASDA